MSEPLTREHVLQAFLNQHADEVQDNPAVRIDVHPFFGYINLRGNAEDSEFLLATRTVLGQDLPLLANTMSKQHNIFSLGPDEWLIVTARDKEKVIASDLGDRLAQQFCAVTDLTGGQIMLRLTGDKARDVLARGCTLDFHPRTFKPGQCAQTGLAKATILIGMTNDEPSYDIIVRRSFAEYVALWLHHAANEYGVKFICTK